MESLPSLQAKGEGAAIKLRSQHDANAYSRRHRRRARAAPNPVPALYPEPFASLMAGREKRPLGDLFGLANFGVDLTRIAPGGCSALRHAHACQDEFIYVLEGNPVLVTDAGETLLAPGICAGFRAGTAMATNWSTAATPRSSI